MKNQPRIIGMSTFLVLIMSGCSKMIEVDSPHNQLTTDKVFADSASALSVMLNCYGHIEQSIYPIFNKAMGLYTDELTYQSSDVSTVEFNRSALSSDNSTNENIWARFYQLIYQCNDILEQLGEADNLSQSFKTTLSAEAHFLRAYAYFHLVNLYGPVPLLLQTDVNATAKALRDSQEKVYSKILDDLSFAKDNLPLSYPNSNLTRATKWAALAFLARVSLQQNNWQAAEAAASDVIGSGLFALDTVATVFTANSKGAILHLWTETGAVRGNSSFVPSDPSSIPQLTLTSTLYSSFEADDVRKARWTGRNLVAGKFYPYSFKYRNRTAGTSILEYLAILRISEQYLIRAESRTRQGKISEALEDINLIRGRSGLSPLPAELSNGQCLDAIMQERRVELFLEEGHRFYDLKRMGQLTNVMDSYKDTWDVRANLLPVPLNEITLNPNLVQNEGY